jgi:hypothetical protein
MTRQRGASAMFALFVMLGLVFPINSAEGAIPKIVNQVVKSKTITCVKGKLVKKVTGTIPKCPTGYKIQVLKPNRITFSLLHTYKVDGNPISLTKTSSASLPVTYQSKTTSVCIVTKIEIQLLSPGKCTITATQNGSTTVVKAVPVTISFNAISQNIISLTLPNSLLFGLKTYSLPSISSAGLPLLYESNTPAVCSINNTDLVFNTSGKCTIRASQAGSDYYESAQTVEASTDIVETRVTSDQPDLITGFQIKPVYVLPFDVTDHFYDTNGFLAAILDEGNAYLKEQLGLQFQIDSTSMGYDIQFLKTKYSARELIQTPKLMEQLFNELKIPDNPGLNRKVYTFFVDVPSFEDGSVCGLGRRAGMFSVVATGTPSTSGGTCSGPSGTFQHYESKTWVHETFHNLDVGHFDNSCDLMNSQSKCASKERPPIDKAGNKYVGASAVAVGDTTPSQNILKLNVWAGYTSRTDLQANCILNPGLRSDGVQFGYCPTGTQQIGALTYCRSIFHTIVLEELRNGAWISLGEGSHWYQPWGSQVDWTCNGGRDGGMTAPWKDVTVTTPGLRQYRWIVDGGVFEELDVLWMQ